MKKILIDANPWQTRIAITRDDALQNIYFSAHATETLERSFFKGKITKILPGIQTAFVDIGQERAGFLHISEIDRELAIHRMTGSEDMEEEAREERQESVSRSRLDISKIFREGEEVLVQVNKEPIHEKGAKLTTCFTLPGRFLVLMPNIPRIGISKKIEEKEERQRLKDLLLANLPEGMGAIIRTTCEHQGAKEILQDLSYLVETWQNIQKRFAQAKPREKLHQDIELYLQIVRDNLDNDVEVILCNNQEIQEQIYTFIKKITPDQALKVQLYKGAQSLFEKFDIEHQIGQALNKKVHLRSGGSIIVETTESMTVIDVNTGRYIGTTGLEDTVLKINLEAAEEIVRQLRLRNIGGLIVIDFIDMTVASHRQKLFKTLEKTLRERDKFQSVVLRVSEFGLVQMTRKRSGKTLVQQMMSTCSSCRGLGVVKSLQTQAYALLDELKEYLVKVKNKSQVCITVHPEILHYITTIEYNSILQFEKQFKCQITLIGNADQATDSMVIT